MTSSLCSRRYSLLFCVLSTIAITALLLFVTTSLFSNVSITKEGKFGEDDSVINLRGNSTNSSNNIIGSEPGVAAPLEKSAKDGLRESEVDDDDNYYDDDFSKEDKESITTVDNLNSYYNDDMSTEENNVDFKSNEKKVGIGEALKEENDFEEVVDLVNQDEKTVTFEDDDAISIDDHDLDADKSSVVIPHDSVTLADGKMYELIGDQLYHDKTHFSQGLTYSRSSGILYESNGLYGKSQVCQLNATTGVTIKCQGMDSKYFAEGMQIYGEAEDEKLIQITWKSKTGFIYDASSLDVIRSFQFTTTKNQGWGICLDEDNDEFIVSDGSQFLHFWDVDTLVEKRKIEVTRQGGNPAHNINELEFMDGKILANIWYEDVLLVIDPESGRCESEYDFSSLWPENVRRKERADALNGISISDEVDVIYMTGKLWDRMFKIRLS